MEETMKAAEQKPVHALPKNSKGTHAAPQGGDRKDAAPLPHEADQDAESQHEHGTRRVGRQAHEDIARGLTDTDRRGGAEYQRQTQDDANASTTAPRSKGKPRR
jgi:hypothetical protein